MSAAVRGVRFKWDDADKFDDAKARKIAETLTYVGSTGIRLNVRFMCLVSRKVTGRRTSLPRLCAYNPSDISKQGNRRKNKVFADGRQSNYGFILCTPAEARKFSEKNRFKPVCELNGDVPRDRYFAWKKNPERHMFFFPYSDHRYPESY